MTFLVREPSSVGYSGHRSYHVESPITNTSVRKPPILAVVMMLFLLPLATFTYGGVHLVPRMFLTAWMLSCGAILAFRGRFEMHSQALLFAVLGIVFSAIPLLPVSTEVRSGLHGDIAVAVQYTHDVMGRTMRPLALDPASALLGWAELVALFVLVLGVAAWSTRAARARMLQLTMVLTGIAVVGTMGVHALLDMDSVYGSGVGLGSREGIYPPFVNPNHAGLFCAALMSVACAALFRGDIAARCAALVAIAVLGFGVWSSGSRGAVVAALAGLAATIAIAGGRTIRMLVVGSVLLTVVIISLTDVELVVRMLGEWVAPTVNQMVDHGYVDITTGRLSLWSDTLQIIENTWLFGVGAGGFDQAYRIIRTDPGFNISTHAHNEPLQLLTEHGVFVALLVCGLLVWLLRLSWKGMGRWKNRPDRRYLLAGFLGGLVALSVSSLVSFPFRLHSHAVLLALCIGGIIGMCRPHRTTALAGSRFRALVLGATGATTAALVVIAQGEVEPFARGEVAYEAGQTWFEIATERETVEGRAEALDASAQHFERAILRDLDRRSYQWLARTRVAQGDSEGADRVLLAATKVYPTMPWLWRDRARIAQRNGDDEKARHAWNRMLAQDLPGSVDPKDVLHEALFGGAFESADAQARAILPERADRYRQAALVMNELGLREEAETLFRHALALEPEGVLYFAKALVGWGRYADAIMLLEPRVRVCAAEKLYATSLAQVGRHAASAEAYASALGLCGAQDWSLRIGLAKARLYAGDGRGADVVETLLDARPDSHGLRRAWLWVLSKRGRTVDAVPHLEYLKWAGVMRPTEARALKRAQAGLPFSLPSLGPTP